jgi:hypothetical protein
MIHYLTTKLSFRTERAEALSSHFALLKWSARAVKNLSSILPSRKQS